MSSSSSRSSYHQTAGECQALQQPPPPQQQQHQLQQQEEHHPTFAFSIDPNSPAPSKHYPHHHHQRAIATSESSSSSSFSPTDDHHDPHHHDPHHQQQHRHMTLWDLISLGVGGTVGSGIFVLTGVIAHEHAGPATFISWALAGICACTSALSLCELASRIPQQGSTYTYCRVTGLGTTCAVVSAACLTLEYVVSGAAVARSWGDKVIWWCAMTFMESDNDGSQNDNNNGNTALDESLQIWQAWLYPGQWVNIPALLISLACTILLLLGVQESKNVANFFTTLKMALVAFLIVGGLALFRPSNFFIRPFCPYGAAGILRGATSSFFGYLGYDEICVVSGEAIRAEQTVPQAILATLAIVTVCYILASIALVGMEFFEDISSTSGFPSAFASANVQWAAQLAASGELITLPVVVLISLLAQPRLTYSMARDGILPPIFARTSPDGNLTGGTLMWGIVMIITAAFVPFTYLDDLISCGILVAFCIANSCLVLMRAKDHHEEYQGGEQQQQRHLSYGERHRKRQLIRSLLAYNTLCCISSLLWKHALSDTNNNSEVRATDILALLMTLATMVCFVYIARQVNPTRENGQNYNHKPIPARARDTYDVIYNQEDDHHDEVNRRHSNNSSTGHRENNNHDNNDSTNRDDSSTNGPTVAGEPLTITPRNQYFQTPCVPLVPCMGIFINWYLIAQLEVLGLVLLILYLGGAVALYRITQRRS